jgi:hypothetical protein
LFLTRCCATGEQSQLADARLFFCTNDYLGVAFPLYKASASVNVLHFWRVRKMKQHTQHNGMTLWLSTGTLLMLPVAAFFIGLGVSQPMRSLVQAQTAVSAPTPTLASLGEKTHLGCQQQLSDGLTAAVKLINTTRQTLPPRHAGVLANANGYRGLGHNQQCIWAATQGRLEGPS